MHSSDFYFANPLYHNPPRSTFLSQSVIRPSGQSSITCHLYHTLEQHCYDWHSALAIPSVALFFLLSFRGSTGLQCSPSLSLNCHDNVPKKPDEARRPPQSRGLCSPLQMTALFHLFSWRKTKGKIEQGIRQAGLNTPERLTPHTVAGSTRFARGIRAVCRDRKR